MKYSKILVIICMVILLTGCSIDNVETNIELPVKKMPGIENSDEDIEMDKDILVMYHDPHDSLEILTNLIVNNIVSDIYEIGSQEILMIEDYEVILIGSVATIDNQLSYELSQFLKDIDMNNKDVSFYWLGAFNNVTYEENLTLQIKNGNILPGIGFNNDDISKIEVVESLLNQWMTSIYWPV